MYSELHYSGYSSIETKSGNIKVFQYSATNWDLQKRKL